MFIAKLKSIFKQKIAMSFLREVEKLVKLTKTLIILIYRRKIKIGYKKRKKIV
jgi:hypothetical protein